MKQNLIIILNLLFFHFTISEPNLGESIKAPTNIENKETTPFSAEVDMGPCTCDLTNVCDYRCCCDKDCDADTINNWKDNNMCFKKSLQVDRNEKFKCPKNRRESFEYNKNKAGMTIKDQIFNIMCVRYDNSGDMGEFYQSPDIKSEVMQDLEKKWKTKFGLLSENVVRRLDDDNNYSYKQKVKNLNSYKADWNGDCTKVEEIYYLKPFESTCRKGDLSKEKLEEDLKIVCGTLKNKIEYNYDETNHYTYISGVTYEIEYSNSTIKSCALKILYTNNASTKTKFKVQWLNVGDSENILAEGYRQGKPIKIGLKDNTYYKNGFFLGISKNDGTCATEYNDISNFKQFLFKVDDINSCTKQDEKFKDTLIYKAFCTEDVLNFKVGKFFNSNLLDLNDENKWIKINVTGCEEVLKEENNNANIGIDINLLFLISKKGDQYSPVEYIEYAKMKLAKGSNNNKIVSFKTTFFEFSYSSITNSKEGKITSLKQFPKDLLESLNPNKK